MIWGHVCATPLSSWKKKFWYLIFFRYRTGKPYPRLTYEIVMELRVTYNMGPRMCNGPWRVNFFVFVFGVFPAWYRQVPPPYTHRTIYIKQSFFIQTVFSHHFGGISSAGKRLATLRFSFRQYFTIRAGIRSVLWHWSIIDWLLANSFDLHTRASDISWCTAYQQTHKLVMQSYTVSGRRPPSSIIFKNGWRQTLNVCLPVWQLNANEAAATTGPSYIKTTSDCIYKVRRWESTCTKPHL